MEEERQGEQTKVIETQRRTVQFKDVKNVAEIK
jgi:hypothetical protein